MCLSYANILLLGGNHMIKQICKLKGYENIRDIYYINEKGNVYSYGNYGNGKSEHPKILKQSLKPCGYMYVVLMTNDRKVKNFRVHRIVASAFVQNPNNYTIVNHLDENKTHNYYSNLEWVTARGNNDYSLAKRVYCYDLLGNLLNVYPTVRDTCSELNLNSGHVACVARGEERQHKNYVFSYIPLSKEEVAQRLSKPFYMKRTGSRVHSSEWKSGDV